MINANIVGTPGVPRTEAALTDRVLDIADRNLVPILPQLNDAIDYQFQTLMLLLPSPAITLLRIVDTGHRLRFRSSPVQQ